MTDHAKEMTIIKTEDGLATVPYWQHEYALWKQRRIFTRATALIGTLAIVSSMMWVRASQNK